MTMTTHVTIDVLINSLEAIRKQRGDLKVVIEDADTGWFLAVETVRCDEGCAVISGRYGNPENPQCS